MSTDSVTTMVIPKNVFASGDLGRVLDFAVKLMLANKALLPDIAYTNPHTKRARTSADIIADPLGEMIPAPRYQVVPLAQGWDVVDTEHGNARVAHGITEGIAFSVANSLNEGRI